MGNQLTGIAPSQIMPVEHYVDDLADIEYESSLGSTRFMKVARARSAEGPLVVKVFVIHDPSLSLTGHAEMIENIKQKLMIDVKSTNCLPFQRLIFVENKSACLIRQYVKDNLYDRISTRPFLAPIEKLWVAFQLLCALNQAHKQNICHGDIKAENCLITSWNWLILTDFASYKPTFLPDNNPADFSYYFDTSRRRTCYVAPERFVSSSMPTTSEEYDLLQPAVTTGELTPAMDIFSAGCVIAELYLDGQPLFDLSSLLAYRNESSLPQHLLSKISDTHLRDLVSSMIQREPRARLSADAYLKKHKGLAFPDSFYTTLKLYLGKFVTLAPPDDKILRIKLDLDLIVSKLSPDVNPSMDLDHEPHLLRDIPSVSPLSGSTKETNCRPTDGEAEEPLKESGTEGEIRLPKNFAQFAVHDVMKPPGNPLKQPETEPPKRSLMDSKDNANVRDGILILSSVVISNIRHLVQLDAKLNSLFLLNKFSQCLPDEIVLDRVLPVLLYLSEDNFPRVRATSIKVLSNCLARVNSMSRENVDIFLEYILPALSTLCSDEDSTVRIALASCVSSLVPEILADSSRRLLDFAYIEGLLTGSSGGEDESMSSGRVYDRAKRNLRESFQSLVRPLLSDPCNSVRRMLIGSNLGLLCSFFGRNKSNDALLSQMITFLNDKSDWELRRDFFTALTTIVTFVGWHCTNMIQPLFEQGLGDSEEFVVHQVINTLQQLLEVGLIQEPMLTGVLPDVLPFIAHPNAWIRNIVVQYLHVMSRVLHPADVYVRLLPAIRPYCSNGHADLQSKEVIHDSVKSPLPRQVVDYMLRQKSVDAVFDYLLSERRIAEKSGHPDKGYSLPKQIMPTGTEPEAVTLQAIRTLTSLGLNERNIPLLMSLREKIHITRLNRSLTQQSISNDGVVPGEIVLSQLASLVTRRHADFRSDAYTADLSSSKRSTIHVDSAPFSDEFRRQVLEESTRKEVSPSSTPTIKPVSSTPIVMSQLVSAHQDKQTSSASIRRSSAVPFEKAVPVSTVKSRILPCRNELRKLVHRQQNRYSEACVQVLDNTPVRYSRRLQKSWKPVGILAAHLHEHKDSVNQLSTSHDHRLFASCSNDGSVKIFDTLRLEGRSVTNSSRATYSKQGGRIKCIQFCQSDNSSLLSLSDQSNINLLQIDAADRSLNASQVVHCDTAEYGHIVDMCQFETATSSVIAYATSHGDIIGCDLRSPQHAWRLKSPPSIGLITSFVVHPSRHWLIAGTSSGIHMCWDMRFQLAVTRFQHPGKCRIRRLYCMPTIGNEDFANTKPIIVTNVHGNNEVSFWDVSTGTREKCLWASPAPSLSYQQRSQHYVAGCAFCFDDQNRWMVSGGSDMSLRLWNFAEPERSFVIARSAHDDPHAAKAVQTSYQTSIVDGTEMIREVSSNRRTTTGAAALAPGSSAALDPPSPGHLDTITDVKFVYVGQPFILSSSRDGVIKAWK